MEKVSSLPNGKFLIARSITYPATPEQTMMLFNLLHLQWLKTDVEWLPSMRGDYADTLQTTALVGAVDGTPVGTASVAFARQDPEVCVLQDVMTRSDYRGLGIARILSEMAVNCGFEAGCKVAYLGNKPTPRCLYEEIGFQRVSGVIMRRHAEGCQYYEEYAFSPGQKTMFRETTWGDLPGIACLLAQPSRTILHHYGQGITSSSCLPSKRCVSNFTSIKYEVESRNGTMFSAVGENPSRVLGFATMIPGPPGLRGETVQLDATVHDSYTSTGKALVRLLLDQLSGRPFKVAKALVAEPDKHKRAWFEANGFQQTASLRSALHQHQTPIDLCIMQKVLP